MKRRIGRVIWNTCERFHIDLGKYAPKVFGWMVGAKPRKVLTKNDVVR